MTGGLSLGGVSLRGVITMLGDLFMADGVLGPEGDLEREGLLRGDRDLRLCGERDLRLCGDPPGDGDLFLAGDGGGEGLLRGDLDGDLRILLTVLRAPADRDLPPAGDGDVRRAGGLLHVYRSHAARRNARHVWRLGGDLDVLK